MARTRAGLAKVLEYRAQERRLRHIDVINAEAQLSHTSQRLTAAEGRLRNADGLGEDARDGAALRAAGRYSIHLRQSVERRQRLAAVAVAHLMRTREQLTMAAREQATIERLLDRRRRDHDGERARTERAMHDESAAGAHTRITQAGRC